MNLVHDKSIPVQQFGRYSLISLLAEGGMAEIYLAVEDTAHAGRRFVIIKRIRKAFESDPDYTEFFLTEARVALKVAHPNMPQAYELGAVDGRYYLAMEYIRGVTLLDLLRTAHFAHTQLSVASTAQIARAVAAALEHCHSLCDVDGNPLKVIHRDVTPQNIIVAYDGTVKLIDFGIAQASIQAHQTDAGVVKGKFSYLAPEMLDRTRSQLDCRADLFSLGIVMHESLTGRSLFRGRTDKETVRRIQQGRIRHPAELRKDVPSELGDVVLRALERDPDQRYQSALELLADLEHVSEQHSLHTSVLRLRTEVEEICGPPTPHVVTTFRGADFEEQPATRAERPVGLDADEELLGFLAMAGVSPRKRRPRRLRTTSADVEFAELLASLER